MKIQVKPEMKQKHNSLFTLLNEVIETDKGRHVIEKVRLDGWILTHFEESKLKEIKPSDYFEIVIYLEDTKTFKAKTKKIFLETIEEIERKITPAASAFQLYDLTRANMLLEEILEGLNSVLAYIDALNSVDGENLLKNALNSLGKLVKSQENENYEKIGEILKEEIGQILAQCKNIK